MSVQALLNQLEPIFFRMHIVRVLLEDLPTGTRTVVPITTPISKSAVEASANKDGMLVNLPTNKVKRLITAFVGSPRHTWRDIIAMIANDFRTFYTLSPTLPHIQRYPMMMSFLHMWLAISHREAFAEEALKHNVISILIQDSDRRELQPTEVELFAETVSSLMNGVTGDLNIFHEALKGMPWLFVLMDVRTKLRQRLLALSTLKRIMHAPQSAADQSRPSTSTSRAASRVQGMKDAILDSILNKNNGHGLDLLIELQIKDKNQEVKALAMDILKVLSEENPDVVKQKIQRFAYVHSLPSRLRPRNTPFSFKAPPSSRA